MRSAGWRHCFLYWSCLAQGRKHMIIPFLYKQKQWVSYVFFEFVRMILPNFAADTSATQLLFLATCYRASSIKFMSTRVTRLPECVYLLVLRQVLHWLSLNRAYSYFFTSFFLPSLCSFRLAFTTHLLRLAFCEKLSWDDGRISLASTITRPYPQPHSTSSCFNSQYTKAHVVIQLDIIKHSKELFTRDIPTAYTHLAQHLSSCTHYVVTIE